MVTSHVARRLRHSTKAAAPIATATMSAPPPSRAAGPMGLASPWAGDAAGRVGVPRRSGGLVGVDPLGPNTIGVPVGDAIALGDAAAVTVPAGVGGAGVGANCSGWGSEGMVGDGAPGAGDATGGWPVGVVTATTAVTVPVAWRVGVTAPVPADAGVALAAAVALGAGVLV